jgi:nitroimidazol reductase NimA-like FMN-containing flavoprotein (pyridoxamine 5'-phosphate oxidase superfamily)
VSDDEKARYLIDNMEFMVLSTADASGKPSVSPVFFSCDEKCNLYWVSSKDAKHSHNVRGRKQVAIAIFGMLPEGVDGIYFDTEAVELEADEELVEAMKVMQKRQQSEKFMIKTLADVTGDACWRIYRATPHEITKREDAIDEASGQTITVRIPVKL